MTFVFLIPLEVYLMVSRNDSVILFILPLDSVTEEVKSVDILAALPTPPHNQNEDIRYSLHYLFACISWRASLLCAGHSLKVNGTCIYLFVFPEWKVMMRMMHLMA